MTQSWDSVEQSIAKAPGCTSPERTPPGPCHTVREASSSLTMTNTASAPAAASAGESAHCAPAPTSADALSWVRL